MVFQEHPNYTNNSLTFEENNLTKIFLCITTYALYKVVVKQSMAVGNIMF